MAINSAQLEYDLSQKKLACFCRLFFYLQLSFFFHCAVLFVACEEIIRFLVFELLFRYVFSLIFSRVFSNVNRDSQRMEVLMFSVSFCPPKSTINSFLRVQFTGLLSRGKEDI